MDKQDTSEHKAGRKTANSRDVKSSLSKVGTGMWLSDAVL